ncbi:MAG: hypothetical protein E2O92_05500 [Alphaproteobacteria bacterium]|nr:MAG: hypothetical protein E2O92_05500 [Alphaproteobacteria bacterium]
MHLVVEETLRELIGAETYSRLHAGIENLARNLRYRYFGYQYWPGTAKYGDPEFSGVVQANYPEDWQRRYVEKDYYQDDPVRIYGLEQEGIIEWKLIPRWNSRQELVMQDAARFGLEDGIVSSFKDSQEGRLQLTFAGGAYEGDYRLASDVLPLLVPVMTVCFRRAHRLEEKLKWLTERQRDVFLLLRKGQRRATIAQTLSLSVRQVDRHILHIKATIHSNEIVGA